MTLLPDAKQRSAAAGPPSPRLTAKQSTALRVLAEGDLLDLSNRNGPSRERLVVSLGFARFVSGPMLTLRVEITDAGLTFLRRLEAAG